MSKESEILGQKRDKNIEILKTIEEFCQRMKKINGADLKESIFSSSSFSRMSSSQISSVDYDKITQMMKIEKEFVEKMKNTFESIEKNEKDQKILKIEEAFEAKTIELNKRIEELKKEIDDQKELVELGKQKQLEIEEMKKREKEFEEVLAPVIKDSIISVEQCKILHNYVTELNGN